MTDALKDTILDAAARGEPLCIRGGGSKDFYGGPMVGRVLAMREHCGILAYEPSELYLTARAGTLLSEIEALLEEHQQMLPFEPPRFSADTTLGGCVAAGLAGPARASVGAVRDFVLGVVTMDGRGRRLRFGGQVMKNVAGFDVARLMCGALGTLGVLLEISIKVLPRPACEATLRFECSATEALSRFNTWAGQPLPISATSAHQGQAYVRLQGGAAAVDAARNTLGGERVDAPVAIAHWHKLRHQHDAFFSAKAPLWRLSLPSTAPVLHADQLIEWGGAQRWWVSDQPAEAIRSLAAQHGGQASLFRGGDRTLAFPPPPPAMLQLQRRLKAVFDPADIFNRRRLCFM